MIQRLKRLLEYIMSEGGGIVVDVTEPVIPRKPELTDDDEESDDEDDDEDKSEELFNQRVKDGKVITTRNDFKPDDRESMVDVKDNANLIKARIRARTPSANFKRKHSMEVRRRKIDNNR